MRKARWVVLSTVLAIASVAGVAGGLLVPVTVQAQEVSAKVGAPLKGAQAAIGKKQWKAALAKLDEADRVTPKSAFEQYKINELRWYVYLQQGRNADAANLLAKQISSPQMPANEKVQRRKTLSQLYFRAENYPAAIEAGNAYLKSVPGDKDTQMLVAQGYYKQKDYKNAIAAGQRAAKSSNPPDEDILQLILRCNYELDDKAGTDAALESLLKYYPTPAAWGRLLDGYISQTKHDHELLALYRLSEDVGALDDARHYTDMTQALVIGGFGIEGERVMQQGLEAGVFEGDSLTRAERTLGAATRKADSERQALPGAQAQLAAAKTGDELYKVGMLYFSAGDYAKASDALAKAVAKGGLSDADAVNMLLGVSLARQGNKSGAIKALDAIKDPAFAEVAKLWKLHVG
jgi:tetratricopeptide (TPR) repeat protein